MPLSFPSQKHVTQLMIRNVAHSVKRTYICVGAYASQSFVLALRSRPSGHYIEQHREGQGSVELYLAPCAEPFISCIAHCSERVD